MAKPDTFHRMSSDKDDMRISLREHFLSLLAKLEARVSEDKEALMRFLMERDHRISDRFKASETAVTESKEYAEKWRASANEWRAAMQDREMKFVSRENVESELKSLRNEIANLRESRSAGVERQIVKEESKGQSQWITGLVITLVLGIIGLSIAVIGLILGRQ